MATAPITVLQIGNFSRPWCSEVAFKASMESLGHRVIPLQENELHWPDVPRLADEHGAHLLCWTRTWSTPREVAEPELRRLRDMGVPSVSVHLDLFLGLDREHQVHDEGFFATDLLATPHDSERWSDLGVRHTWFPPGVHGAECGVVVPNPRRFPHDIVFVGSHPYPHPEWEPVRTGVIEAFQREFGRRFAVWPRRGQPIRGRRLQELYATAKVVVGDSCLVGNPRAYLSDRTPESLGRGAFLLHPSVPEMVGTDVGPWGYTHGEHLMAYPSGDGAAAVALAHEALADPAMRERVSAAGRALVLGRDTYVHRMGSLLAEVEAQFGPWRDAPAPSPPPAPKVVHPRVRVRFGPRWRAEFDPRDVDMQDGRFMVVDEVWKANDYRVPPTGLHGAVLDIGANIGAFSVLAAKAGASRVIAVEPHPGNRARLEHHLTLNGVADRVEVLALAVTRDGIGTVSMVGDGGGAFSVGAGDIATISLRDLLVKYGPISFMKSDAEGAELDYLLADGMKDLLNEHVEALACEFHGPVMPHLAHLNEDGGHLDRWKAMVAMLTDCGRLEIMGHPMVGGLIHWHRF